MAALAQRLGVTLLVRSDGGTAPIDSRRHPSIRKTLTFPVNLKMVQRQERSDTAILGD